MEFDVNPECPSCNKEILMKVQELVPGTSIDCPHCNETIELTGDDGRKIKKELDNIEKSFKNLFK